MKAGLHRCAALTRCLIGVRIATGYYRWGNKNQLPPVCGTGFGITGLLRQRVNIFVIENGSWQECPFHFCFISL